MNIIILFTILTIVNVIFSTIKSIVTIKSGPWIASIVSALYYGYYNIVLIYTVADFPLWQKVVITSICNLVGVFIVKYGEIRARKDKLWLVRFTISKKYLQEVHNILKDKDISHSYIDIGDNVIFDTYCNSKEDTDNVKNVISCYNGKYFVIENKISL